MAIFLWVSFLKSINKLSFPFQIQLLLSFFFFFHNFSPFFVHDFINLRIKLSSIFKSFFSLFFPSISKCSHNLNYYNLVKINYNDHANKDKKAISSHKSSVEACAKVTEQNDMIGSKHYPYVI